MNIKQKRKRSDVEELGTYLHPNESILWIGQPNPLWLFSPKDIYLIPFSLLWGGFAIFWELIVLVSSRGAPSLFTLWGIPFIIVGQYFIWGRFVHKYLLRRRTYYAVSGQRVFILQRLLGNNLKVYFLGQIASLECQGKAILFDTGSQGAPWWSNRQDWSGESQPGFYALVDVDEVYRLLQNLIMERQAANRT